jgi:hypothetical protein
MGGRVSVLDLKPEAGWDVIAHEDISLPGRLAAPAPTGLNSSVAADRLFHRVASGGGGDPRITNTTFSDFRSA